MPKLCQICRFSKWTFFLVFPIVVTINFLINYGTLDNPYIARDEIDSVLYKEVIPTVLKKGKPACNYKYVLNSTETINVWDLPTEYNDFDDEGLENGSYSPGHCNPLFSVAILVTYRNRQKHLDTFLPYMHNFLRKQGIHYKIYIIEQQDDKPWNKGLLYNIGARQAIADQFPCLILHDIDLLPLDDSNLYVCTTLPRHLSASLDKHRFELLYDWLVGGVLAIRSDQYQKVDGFSNRFLNWGAEDDDFYMRMQEHNLKVVRFPREMSRYTMLRHPPSPRNGDRRKLLASNRYETPDSRATDGMRAAQASVTVATNQLVTLIMVNT